MIFLGLDVGSWADWFGAFGTILAVIVALRLRTDRSKLNLIVTYSKTEIWEVAPLPFVKDGKTHNEGELTGLLDDCIEKFDLYVTNSGGANTVITSWGIISNNKLHTISETPLVVKGLDVATISIRSSLDINYPDGPSWEMTRIGKLFEENEENIVFVKTIDGKTLKYNVKAEERSNKDDI